MNVIARVNLFIWLWVQTLKGAKRPATWAPFVLLAGAHFVVLTILLYFMYPPFSMVLIPLMTKVFGEAALHYPYNFLILPQLSLGGGTLVEIFVGSLVMGGVTLSFAAHYKDEGKKQGSALARAAGRYPTLLALTAVTTLLPVVIMILPQIWLPEGFAGSPRIMSLFRGALFLIAAAAQGLFSYGVAASVLDGRKLGAAVRESMALFRRYALTTILLVAIPGILTLPVGWVANRGPALAQRMSPEILAVIEMAGILVSVATSWILAGTLTGVYLFEKSQREQ